MKKRILIFSNFFIPFYKAGGPVRSVLNLSLVLVDTFDVYILTANHEFGNDNNTMSLSESDSWVFLKEEGLNVYYISKSKINNKTYWNIIRELSPSYILLNSFFNFNFTILPLFVVIIRNLGCKIVLAPRGELNTGALNIKYFKKYVYLYLFKLFNIQHKVIWNSTNELEKNRIEEVIGGNLVIRTLSNVTVLPSFNTDKEVMPLTNGVKFVFISRICEMKNLKFLLNVLSSINSQFYLDIYGPIEDLNYWDSCCRLIENFNENVNVKYIGEIIPSNIFSTLQEYHFFILPTLGENFGHIIFESLSASVPVIISNNTPWGNLSKTLGGLNLSLLNIDIWINELERLNSINMSDYLKMSEAARQLAVNYVTNSDFLSKANELFN